jgi:hypothetical protein
MERFREYVVRKFIRARNAAEAIALEKNFPVIEVNEMKDKSDVQNPPLSDAIGFQMVRPEED